ncbi:addiction module antidote protein [Vibrio owensii]|uniref:addiction module antidote protein n=1 Tax=Vibrio owensii TaxID=696485 RepID=UPI0018F1F79B|nr:addiction module antidote protein [Vibrio owensii]
MATKEENILQYRILTVPGFKQKHLDAAAKTGDTGRIATALGQIAKAKGMKYVAFDTGLCREGLYRTFGPKGNPPLSSLIKFASSLDVEIRLVPTQQN